MADVPSGGAEATAPVRLLREQKEAFVEEPDLGERSCPDEEERADEPVRRDLARIKSLVGHVLAQPREAGQARKHEGFSRLPGGGGEAADRVLQTPVRPELNRARHADLGPRVHGEHWSNFLVRNNSTNKAIGIGLANSTGSSLRFLANIAPSFQGCGRAGVSAHYNIWYRGSRCGRHDRVASSGFRASGKHDFHLRPGAPAVDRGDPGSFSNRDYDGQHRPKGRLPDAGADERG